MLIWRSVTDSCPAYDSRGAPLTCSGSAVAWESVALSPLEPCRNRKSAAACWGSEGGILLQVADVGQAEVVDAGGHLAGVVVGEVLLGILRSHRGQQECPALLVDGLVVQWPCSHALHRSTCPSVFRKVKQAALCCI